MIRLSEDELRAARTRAQLLTAPRAASVAEAVARAGAVQAQSANAARLAVRARTRGLTAGDVDAACDTDRTVVRTWLMRGTLHMVPTADIGWMVRLLGPVYRRAGRRRRAELRLDDVTCERALAALPEILAGSGPLTRAELVTRLARNGVHLEAKSQAPAHLLVYAASHGLICRGPEARNDESTYVLLDEWTTAVRAHQPDDPRAELARRYLTGYGPATVADFLTWSGLPAADGRAAFAAIADELGDVDAAGTPAVALASNPPDPREDGPREDGPREDDPREDDPREDDPLRLLGPFDPYLLGHRTGDLVLTPGWRGRIRRGGMIHPTILVDGRVHGTWRLVRRARTSPLVLEPFDALPPASEEALRAEAADVGRFLGVNVQLTHPH